MRLRVVACGSTAMAAVVLVGAMSSSGGRQRTYLDDVRDRAAYYVVRYEKECSGIVAEEHYTQQLKWGCRIARGGAVGDAQPSTVTTSRGESQTLRRERGPIGATHRELVSDVLMVQVPDKTWVGFRDVAIVDGQPVRDRTERLEALFLRSPATLRQIQQESARYNIGPIRPEFNLPTFALAYLHPGVRDRFAFYKAAEEIVDGTKTFVIAFAEIRHPTVVSDGRGHDVPSSGEFWINPASGFVVKSHLVAGDDASDARVESLVTYAQRADWPLLLPSEMHETYDRPVRPDGPCVVGFARYSNFRRFQVTVDEKVTVPK